MAYTTDDADDKKLAADMRRLMADVGAANLDEFTFMCAAVEAAQPVLEEEKRELLAERRELYAEAARLGIELHGLDDQ